MDHHLSPHRREGHRHDEHEGLEGLPELLDLDAEILAGPLQEVRADIDRLADSQVRRILDLGAGTGTGTFGLLQHFTEARVVAVDASEEMLERLRGRAQQLGVSDRVATRCVDLDHAVPELEPVDLAWASAFLHHLADPDRTLPRLVASIRPGGLLAVVELAGFPRFLAEGTPDGDAEARAHELLAADRERDVPAMGSDWGPRLTRAGLVVELDRPIVVDLEPPLTPQVGDYAAASLTRLRDAVSDRLGSADRVRFDGLLGGGPSDVRRRSDLCVTTERRLWVARRPRA